MIERQAELRQRYTRKAKMKKLKKKLETATGEAREKILYKIHRHSPFWTESAAGDGAKPAAKEPRKRAPAKAKK